MKIKDFLVVTTSFLENNLEPGLEKHLGGAAPWIMGGIMAGLSRGVASKIEENSEMLKLFGVMDSDGEISIDGFEEFMHGAFAKCPELRIDPQKMLGLKFNNPLVNDLLDGEMVFNEEEAKQLIEMLRSR